MLDYDLLRTRYNRCFQRINWERIHKVMVALDWKYDFNEKGNRFFAIPRIVDMQATMDNLFHRCLEQAKEQSDPLTVSTGGFSITINCDDNYVSIAFVIEYADEPMD